MRQTDQTKAFVTARTKIRVATGILCLLSLSSIMLGYALHLQRVKRDRALVQAVFKSDPDAVRSLLTEGANANARVWDHDEPPFTFLTFCTQVFGVGTKSAEEKRTALMVASGHSDLTTVKMLLDAGANVNAREELGLTALHYATGILNRGAGPVIFLLVKHGADVKAKTKDGTTVWTFAQCNPENMKALKQALTIK